MGLRAPERSRDSVRMRAPAGLWKQFGVHQAQNPPGAVKRPEVRVKRVLESWRRLRPLRGATQEEANEIDRFPPPGWPHF